MGVGLACALMMAAACGGQAVNERERVPYEKLMVGQRSGATILKERQEAIKKLTELAGMPGKGWRNKEVGLDYTEYPSHDAKHLAMLLLGDLRASEGVPVLLENIEYRVPKFMALGYELGPVEGPGWHPAVESLIKIGMPAVGPVIEKLGTYAQDCLGRRLCLVVLKEILGPRLAKIRIEIAVEEAKDDAARAKLKAALAQLEADRAAAAPQVSPPK
jgi:hypothetical protein